MTLIRSARRIVTFAVLAVAVAGTAALAVLPQQAGNINLLTQANVTFAGAVPEGFAGWSVAGAGDVNGDGIRDVIIGAPGEEGELMNAGRAYVVFGLPAPVNLDLGALPVSAGFRIDGVVAGNFTGSSVAGAGDVNGDGRDDVIVSAMRNLHRAYVVFGSPAPVNVNLGALPSSAGFRIDGADLDGTSSTSVSGSGDVNGDGKADVIIGAPSAASGAGRSYVVFGSSSPVDVNLDALPSSAGFRIDGAAPLAGSGTSVSGAGDVNGDGRADVIIGAPLAGSFAGESHVVFGSQSPVNVNLGSLSPAAGFRIDGAAPLAGSGTSVSGAGDVNGDGRADVIIGAPVADSFAGESHVVFGSQSPVNVNLGTLSPTAGFRIDGATAGARSGTSVSGADDVNGDGRADVIIGAPGTASHTGASHVVFGSPSPGNVNLGALPSSAGLRIDGAARGDNSGYSVAGAGDVNGDGRADVLVGARQYDTFVATGPGRAYVVYGFGTASVSYPGTVSAVAGSAITALRPVVARTGVASFAVSPPLPAGIVLDTATGVISGTTAQAASGSVTVTMSDLTGQASTSVQVAISAAPVAAAPLPRLAGTTRCTQRRCTTTGRAPRSATKITQAATARARRATGRCTITTEGAGPKAPRTYRCTIVLAKGWWTITTTALTRTTPISRSARALTVR